MKTFNSLLAAAVVSVGVAVSAQAGEPFLSPRAQDIARSLKTVPTQSEKNPNLLANRPVGNARAWALAQSLRTVPGARSSVDLAHAQRPTLSPKDPSFESAWRANAENTVQVAPLK
jgi:hypothetical protein